MAVVATALLALLLPQGASPPAGVRNDDAAVIEVAMLQFFTPKAEEWQSVDWREGQMAIVLTQLASKKRPSGQELLQEWIDAWAQYESDPKHGKRIQKELAPLRETLKEFRATTGSFAPPSVVPLATLNLGAKVIVGDPKFGRFGMWSEAKLPGLKGTRPRVLASIWPPSYSADGSLAVVKMHSPWSIHSADVFMGFRRTGNRWRRLFAVARFYP